MSSRVQPPTSSNRLKNTSHRMKKMTLFKSMKRPWRRNDARSASDAFRLVATSDIKKTASRTAALRTRSIRLPSPNIEGAHGTNPGETQQQEGRAVPGQELQA